MIHIALTQAPTFRLPKRSKKRVRLMQIHDWLPLISVLAGTLLGWFLSQLGQWSAARRDEKKAIAQTLSELLEIHHRLLAVPKTVELLSQSFPLPPEGQLAMKVTLGRLLPADVDLAKRYGDAVSLVAACNPVLGFRLRSQDIVSSALDVLRQLALADTPATVAVLSKLEQKLMGHLSLNLEELLREIAWKHGILTWWRVQRRLKRPLKIPDGLFESLKTELSKTQ